ncbi:MAG: hypothetical protein NTY12_00180 [Candidatus Falkowbacteria bacterium]|nr:hypothetical protein [Candidatus Falkowbacteria bacterium]
MERLKNKATFLLFAIFIIGIVSGSLIKILSDQKDSIKKEKDSCETANHSKIFKLEYNRDLALKLVAHDWQMLDRYTISREENGKEEVIHFENPINTLGRFIEQPIPRINTRIKFYVPSREEIGSLCGYADDYLLCDGLLLCKVIN